MENIKYSVLIMYAAVCAVSDLKRRSISVALSLAAAALGWCFMLAGAAGAESLPAGALVLGHAALSIIPGACVVLLSLISCGSVGLGDGLFLTVCGIYLGLYDTLALGLITWFLCAGAALFMIAAGGAGKGTGRENLPFVTFALPALILVTGGKYVPL